MKTIAIALAIIAVAITLHACTARANDTEDRIHEGMKAQVGEVVNTLALFAAFDQSYRVAGTNDSALSREAMLIKVARRLQQQAQQLAAKAEAMEVCLTLEQATEPEAAPDKVRPELEQTRESIAALKRQLEELKGVRVAKKVAVSSAVVQAR